MGIPGSVNNLLGAGGAPQYLVERSLRFNSSDSAYLSRTPASAGNRKTFTISLWIKRCKLGVLQSFTSSVNNTILLFDANDKLNFYLGAYVRTSTQVFRDTSAWYHIVLAVDTPNATAQNRVRMYVNNSEITAWDVNVTVTQNVDTTWNGALAHQIGANNTSQFADQYIADFHNIDGQALTPSSFTEVSATTGQLIPKAYTGSFGTNGFWLKFSDNSAATATTLGKDYSGNSNNWSPTNLSVTAGAGNDSLTDTPTSYGTDTGAGGEVRGNYCTWNATNLGSGATLANGNLDFSAPTSDWRGVTGTFAVSTGKWYWEITLSSFSSAFCQLGIQAANAYNPSSNTTAAVGSNLTGYAYRSDNGNKINNNSSSAYGASFTAGDVVGVALDLDAGTLVFYKNGASQGTAFSSLSGTFNPAISCVFGTNLAVANFGQRPFAYTAPSGFKALCDTSLPTPTIAKGSTAMDVKLYTGNGSTQTISGLNFSPDFVWTKARSFAENNNVFDTVRGTTKLLLPDQTNAEQTISGITAFNSDGYTVGSHISCNSNGQTYVAWTWDAGSTTVTNTQGSITSQVRTNGYLSIVTYTGNSTVGATVGHGLGVAPQLIIIKGRNNVSGGYWQVYHQALGNTKYLELNSTTAANTSSNRWNNTTPSSTVFTLGSDSDLNGSLNYVAYCFAPVSGYSSFGSYTGNGSADGPFVFCNFRPRWVMWKCTTAAYDWDIYDAVRDSYNAAAARLKPNSSDAEATLAPPVFDILSNGFKLRQGYNSSNANSQTYIYAAFAENPFQYARAR